MTRPEPPADVPLSRQDRLHAAGWRHNLPQPLTSFVGREREIAEMTRLLGSARLVTLTGTGGVGKTRLGHEVAARMLDPALSGAKGRAFHGGVWVVELAALTDPALVSWPDLAARACRPDDAARIHGHRHRLEWHGLERRGAPRPLPAVA